MNASLNPVTRHNWTLAEVSALLQQPFNDLIFQAQTTHRQHFNANRVQVSTLLSIKTGACPEDCKYCPQSGHYNTGLDKEKLMEVQKVLDEAKRAKDIGSTRFCMGAVVKDETGCLINRNCSCSGCTVGSFLSCMEGDSFKMMGSHRCLLVLICTNDCSWGA